MRDPSQPYNQPNYRKFIVMASLLALVLALTPLLVTYARGFAQEGTATVEQAAAFLEPTYSSPIVMSSDKNLIWVVNPDDDSVSVLGNLDAIPSEVGQFTVGDEPQSIALDLSVGGKYRVYVANAASNNVTILNVTASSASSVAANVEKIV